MSKYRCPVCGAPHKDPVAKCRLCGQDMSSPAAVPVNTSGARQVAAPKKGIGVFLWIALGVILLILVGAIAFGATRDADTVEDVKRAIPGIEETPDGWVTIEDADGGFTASMPPGNTSDLASAYPQPPASGRWVGKIGQDTVLSITYYDLGTPEIPMDVIHFWGEGEAPMNVLKGFAIVLDQGRGDAEINQPVTESGFAGYPALEFTMRHPNTDYSSKMLLILKGDRIYVLESLSIYPDHPSFDNLVNDFAFVLPPTTTTTAPAP